ncbi:recombinase family protein [Streptomyces sp. UC4497]
MVWRLDRLVRKVSDLDRLIHWADGHGGKAIVSVTEPFDLTAPAGRAMAAMIASFARMESRAASDRVTSMRHHLLPTPRWGGGSPPYGYRTHGTADGRYLEIHPDTAPLVHEAARRVISGEAVNAICRDFEARGLPSPSDSYQRRKAERDFVWHPVTLKRILSSPTLLGFKTRNEAVPGKKYRRRVPVVDQHGDRVRIADPLLTTAEWEDLQKALDAASTSSPKPESPRTPLLGVIKCGGCGKNLQIHTTQKKRKDGSVRATSKIRCLSRPGAPACRGYVFSPQDELVAPVLAEVYSVLGEHPVTHRLYAVDGPSDHWGYQETGGTFRERWDALGIPAVTADLLRAGVTIDCHPPEKGGHVLRVSGTVRQRLALVDESPH